MTRIQLPSTSETVITGGDRIVQQAVRDMAKAKKAAKAAAQYKKACNSKLDAHPTDMQER